MRVLLRPILVVLLGAAAPSLIVAQVTVREVPTARQAIDATGFIGSILVHDLATNSYSAGHAERVDRRLIPASTFKILNALIALETGVVTDAHTVIKWDGVVRDRTELNRDRDLQTAFRLSAVPHFQELARRIGAERMQRFVDAVGYGNGDTSGGIDQFWLTGGLRVSPREQVEFLSRLHRRDLPFSIATMATVKAMMVAEQTEEHVIRAKTGLVVLPQGEHVGWWVGWVERGGRVHVFATVLETTTPGQTFVPARQGVTRMVLGQLGVLSPAQ